MENKDVTLSNLNGGVLPAYFNEEMKRIIANIEDESTKLNFGREINLKIVFTPEKNRQDIHVRVSSAVKLAPLDEHGSHLTIIKGKAIQLIHEQEELDFDDGKIVTFNRKEVI